MSFQLAHFLSTIRRDAHIKRYMITNKKTAKYG